MTPTRLAHYDILEPLGAGGMGEVYRARDTKLGREVALKLLPETFARDPERLARFEREARLLASLSHPHIASIHGLEEDKGTRFLVLELVAGEDLSRRIARGAVAVDESLALAQQTAEALEAAHEAGVIHRDLKPANIVVTPAGSVKVLDFGLARAFDPASNASNLSQSPTLLGSSPTMQGVILGTAAYMSPEQARGKVVDKRADIFAFGCVLYEMLTGRQLFSGETVSDTLAAVLRADVEWAALPADTPRAIQRLLRRCLEKDPRRRLRDIGEAVLVLDDVRAGREIEEPAAVGAPSIPKRRFVTPRATAVIVALLAVVAAASSVVTRMLAPRDDAKPIRKFLMDIVAVDSLGAPEGPRLSPDGGRIAYVCDGRVWVRALDQLESRPIAKTSSELAPFWSPDGKYVGYATEKRLWKVAASGGDPTPICDSPADFGGGSGATWGENGRIVFSFGNGGIYEASADGGDARELLAVDGKLEQDFHEPWALPGKAGVIAVQHRVRHGPDTILLYTAGGERKTLIQLEGQNIWSPMYSPTGHLLFTRLPDNAGLWAVPFSLQELEITGEPFLVAPKSSESSTSEDGTLAYLPVLTGDQARLVWFDGKGRLRAYATDVLQSVNAIALSPDGRRVALSMREGATRDIWVIDLERNTRSRLTFSGNYNTQPAWSPDGRTIAYRNVDEQNVWLVPSDGSGKPRAIASGAALPSFTPDGKWVLFSSRASGSPGVRDADLFMVDATGADTTRVPVFTGVGNQRHPIVSPDGRYLAFISDEAGTSALFLTGFPTTEGKWQVSVSGSVTWPRWSPDSRALYYVSGDRVDMVAVEPGEAPRLGTPAVVLPAGRASMETWGFNKLDVARDGSVLLVQTVAAKRADSGVVIVQNWLAEFADHQPPKAPR